MAAAAKAAVPRATAALILLLVATAAGAILETKDTGRGKAPGNPAPVTTTTEAAPAPATHQQQQQQQQQAHACIPGAAEDNLDVPQTTANLSHITEFGLTLFKQLFPYNTTDRNFFFSPYSVWSGLSLAYFGSGGHTEEELTAVLGVQDKLSALKNWRALEFLYAMRQANKTSYTFNVANRAYFDETVALRPCAARLLPSELRTVDFRQPLAAAEEINSFVANITKGRITDLVTGDQLVGARMVLANAAFFKGQWLYQFKESATSKGLFYSSFEDYTFVDMMRQKGNFRYGVSEELGASILELPYSGEAISMFILLPPFLNGEGGFSAMVERLNAPMLHHALSNTWRTQMEVVIPKFKLEQLVKNELIQALRRMGIRDLFDPSRANLTTFTQEEQVSVGKSVHKAFVEVSEEGTEAAAATALISWRIARPLGPTKFEANHPFLFLIYDNLTQNILFLGAYKNPKAS